MPYSRELSSGGPIAGLHYHVERPEPNSTTVRKVYPLARIEPFVKSAQKAAYLFGGYRQGLLIVGKMEGNRPTVDYTRRRRSPGQGPLPGVVLRAKYGTIYSWAIKRPWRDLMTASEARGRFRPKQTFHSRLTPILVEL
jgi:hypothetical protein